MASSGGSHAWRAEGTPEKREWNYGWQKTTQLGFGAEKPSAQVLDFIAEGELGLLGLAAAADVVSADCRLNHWIATYLKGTDQSEEKWLELLDEIEKD